MVIPGDAGMSADIWKFGTITLTTLGIITKLSDSLEMPARRGDNIIIPFRHGRIWTKKYYDQRTILLGMALTETSAAALETKMDTIKVLCGLSAQQMLEVTLEDASVRQAYAEVAGKISVARLSAGMAKLVIPFTLNEPFFRSNILYSLETTIDASPHAFDPNNSGTVEECGAIITFTGPMEHPKLEHIASGVYVQYDAHISNGDTVTINCKEYTAVHSVSGNVINSIIHHGDPTFMVLLPGANHLHATDSNPTTGKAKIEFYPPFL
jgi:phage-related protein